MSATGVSVAMLKKSLEANGLMSSGTKEDMLVRLLSGGGKKKVESKQREKKKSDPKTSVSKTTSAQIKLFQPLDATQARKCGLKLVGTEPSSTGVSFVYEPITLGETKPTKPTVKATTKKVAAKTEVKRDRDDDDSESDSDDDMDAACDVTVTRLLKKAKKEHIAALCGDFGVSVSGTKQELAENLAEQLHYETDTDDEDEE